MIGKRFEVGIGMLFVAAMLFFSSFVSVVRGGEREESETETPELSEEKESETFKYEDCFICEQQEE